MKLTTLIFWLTVIVVIMVYIAGNYIDFIQESNRVTINHVLENQR